MIMWAWQCSCSIDCSSFFCIIVVIADRPLPLPHPGPNRITWAEPCSAAASTLTTGLVSGHCNAICNCALSFYPSCFLYLHLSAILFHSRFAFGIRLSVKLCLSADEQIFPSICCWGEIVGGNCYLVLCLPQNPWHSIETQIWKFIVHVSLHQQYVSNKCLNKFFPYCFPRLSFARRGAECSRPFLAGDPAQCLQASSTTTLLVLSEVGLFLFHTHLEQKAATR